MPEIAGVLCDLDGTLVDSEWVHVKAWDVIAERYGLELQEGWDADYVGKPDAYQAKKMCEMFPVLPAIPALLVERHGIYQDLLRKNRDGITFPGVEDGVRALEANGFKLALGSNSPMANCVAALEAAGLARYFEIIVAFGMVKEGKPAPDIYLEAAKRLGLRPTDCAVIEDTEIGLSSGKAAGCLALGVTTTHPPEKLKSADLVFPSTATALEWLRAEGRSACRA